MSEYTLSEAINDLPEDMLLEADETPRTGHGRRRIIWVAACLVVIIGLLLAPGSKQGKDSGGGGLLCVTVYAEDRSSVVLSNDTVSPYFSRWDMTNWAPGLPITLSVSEDNGLEAISFKVRVDGGYCYVDRDGGASVLSPNPVLMEEEFVIPNNTTIFWSKHGEPEDYGMFWRDGERAFLDIIVYEGSRIIGYVVLRFDRVSDISGAFDVSMVSMVEFGSDMEVTSEYVDACLAEVHG